MDDNPLQQRFHHIAESALLSCLEPSPIQFRQEHEGGAARIVFAIRRASADEPVALRSRVNRNGFLLGCCNYTDRRTEEHLIVGYGFRQASTTRIERVHHVIGSSR